MCLCVYVYLHVCGVCMLTYACSPMLVFEGQRLMLAFFSLNIFFALFLETGFLKGLSAGSFLFCLDWTTCKSQRSSCLNPSVVGLHVHIPCPTFFLWVLGIHTQVLILVQQVVYRSTISPALFFLILSHFFNGRLLLCNLEPRLYQTPGRSFTWTEVSPSFECERGFHFRARHLMDPWELGALNRPSVFIDVVLYFTS